MAQPSDIEVTRTVEYRLGVDYQLNEETGLLWPLCGSYGNYTDKKTQIEDQFDDLVATEKDGRNTDTVNTDMNATRRWIAKPKTQNVAPLLDRDDAISTKLDLNSPAAKQTAKAIRQAQDDRWLQAYYGSSLTGEEGTVAVAFKAANIMAADYGEAGASGITLNKLIGMRKLMRQRFVDLRRHQPFAIVTAEQTEDLLKIAQLQSSETNPQAVQALQNGEVSKFMGFTFIPAELGNAGAYPLAYGLTIDGGSHRRVPFFVKAAMHGGIWTEFWGKISDRGDKNHSMQIYGETCVRGSRVREDYAFQMLCAE